MTISITSLGESKKTGNKDQIRFCCPVCGEQKYKFYVHLLKRVYICHKCKVAGRIDDIQLPVNRFDEKVKQYSEQITRKIERKKVFLPEGCEPIDRHEWLPYKYLRDRGMDNREIREFRLMFCSSGKYEGRIILPVYSDDGQLLYFMGRTIHNNPIKYMNAEASKEGVIWKSFKGRIKKAVIVEGVFDAISVARVTPSIATLGKAISDSQILEIVKSCEEAYILLDPDAHLEALKSAHKLNYFMKTFVKLIPEGSNDPGSMSPEQIREVLK